jgi:hypothetical protein
MNKCDDKFCDLCGHHLYTVTPRLYWCVECQTFVSPENIATFEQVAPMRAAYDADARRLDSDGESA